MTAVCNIGGLGSIGCVGQPSDLVREQVATVRQATDRPLNLNFFAQMSPQTNPEATARVRAKLAPYFDEFGLGVVPEPNVLFSSFDAEQLDLVLELRPRVVSFHFGLPETTAVQRLKGAGCIILSSATTVAEARSLEANGADVIIAQGFDAGGHRGSFSGRAGAGMVGTMALVPQIVDAVRVPVIAAGGIADGRGIAAAFALGASGVQMGTAFLGCPETAVSLLYRARLQAATDDATELTRAFTGRPAVLCATVSWRKWPTPSRWTFRCKRFRRPALATAGRGGASGLYAGLGGSSCSAGARPARGSADRGIGEGSSGDI